MKKLGFKEVKFLSSQKAGLSCEPEQSDFRHKLKQKLETQHPFQGGSEASSSNRSGLTPPLARLSEGEPDHPKERPVRLACPLRGLPRLSAVAK